MGRCPRVIRAGPHCNSVLNPQEIRYRRGEGNQATEAEKAAMRPQAKEPLHHQRLEDAGNGWSPSASKGGPPRRHRFQPSEPDLGPLACRIVGERTSRD